jgi:hypothetical protein
MTPVSVTLVQPVETRLAQGRGRLPSAGPLERLAATSAGHRSDEAQPRRGGNLHRLMRRTLTTHVCDELGCTLTLRRPARTVLPAGT